jgi:iron complex transport system substrate-binding protein
MRVCSLLPGATEIAFALGLGDNVVGVTHECDYPPAARQKPVVVRSAIDSDRMTSLEIDRWVSERLRRNQGLYVIDASRLHEAAPDVILTQGLCDVCAIDYDDVVSAAQALSPKPKIVTLTPHCLTDILTDVTRVGEATERPDPAEGLVRDLERRISAVRERTAQSSSRPRVACIEWLDPIYAAGHWVPEMVRLAGGHDGLGREGEPSAKIAWAKFLEFDPEVIALMPCGFDIKRTLREAALLERLDGWRSLPAFRTGRVYALNGHAFFSRPGPRLIDGLEILSAIIHPETFPVRIAPEMAQRIV